MLRQLLTLLALVSGLGLATTPAVAAQASVVSIASAGSAEDCQTSARQQVQQAPRSATGRSTAAASILKPADVLMPTVQLQADRARE